MSLKRSLRSSVRLRFASQGNSAVDAIRSIRAMDATFYRWRQEYGGLKVDQVKRMKELEAENARLRRSVSDLTLEKLVFKEAASGNFKPGASPGLCEARRGRIRRIGAVCLPGARTATSHVA
jgi:hypothetical protein